MRRRLGDAVSGAYFLECRLLYVLSHLASPALQDRLFAEVLRVVRPGGIFAGTDSTESWLMRTIPLGDTIVLVDPPALPALPESAGSAVWKSLRTLEDFDSSLIGPGPRASRRE